MLNRLVTMFFGNQLVDQAVQKIQERVYGHVLDVTPNCEHEVTHLYLHDCDKGVCNKCHKIIYVDRW